MRDDLAQLLVETPRHNTGEFYRVHRRKAKQDLDSAPTKQGMRKPYRERKEFGEYFVPLRGLLRKNVGRPWDKVFSELISVLHGGGTVVEHTKQHLLRDFIVLKPHWINNKPHHPPMWGQGGQGPRPLNDDYYVDRHGILRHAKARPQKRPVSVVAHVKIDDSTAFHKIDGLWYRVWTKLLPLADRERPPIFDLVLKKWVRCVGYKPYSIRKVAETMEVMSYRWEVAGTTGVRELESLHGSGTRVFDGMAPGSTRVAYRKESISSRTIRREGLDVIK